MFYIEDVILILTEEKLNVKSETLIIMQRIELREPDLFGGVPEIRGPCQQLLTLLILKSATGNDHITL